jgi:hypothetical protein
MRQDAVDLEGEPIEQRGVYEKRVSTDQHVDDQQKQRNRGFRQGEVRHQGV